MVSKASRSSVKISQLIIDETVEKFNGEQYIIDKLIIFVRCMIADKSKSYANSMTRVRKFKIVLSASFTISTQLPEIGP